MEHIQHILIEIARAIDMYWLCVVVGIALATWLALRRRRANHFHVSAKDVLLTTLSCVVGGFIGAKVLQLCGLIIRYGVIPGFWTFENWKSMMPSAGVFYGGLIGGFFTGLLYVHKRKVDFREITDILMPALLLGHAFGRFGCFFAGCCYGRVADWGIALHGDIPRIPVQLFEAGFDLLVMLAMLIFRPERKRPGILLPLYLIVYAAGRFILEFFRGDEGRGIVLLSTSQWISLLIFPIGIMLLWRTIRQDQKKFSA